VLGSLQVAHNIDAIDATAVIEVIVHRAERGAA
jgi:hypothetical protein